MKKIKKKSFRPFAPSILEGYVDEYFEQVIEFILWKKSLKFKKINNQRYLL